MIVDASNNTAVHVIPYSTYLTWTETYMHKHHPGKYSRIKMPVDAQQHMITEAGVTITLKFQGQDVYVKLNIVDARKFTVARLMYNL